MANTHALSPTIIVELLDGNPRGLIRARIQGWIGQAMLCPRTDLKALLGRTEARRPGIYILVGLSETNPFQKVFYVGQSGLVSARLSQHHVEKENWDSVILFSSQAEDLPPQKEWLEFKLLDEIRRAKRDIVSNHRFKTNAQLAPHETSGALQFLDNMKKLALVLGIDILPVSVTDKSTKETGSSNASLEMEMFILNVRAQCEILNGQFLVKKGSGACLKDMPSISASVKMLRKQLVESGVMQKADGESFKFEMDYAFASASQAAGVIAGSSVSGRTYWKFLETQQTYGEWLAQQALVDESQI